MSDHLIVLHLVPIVLARYLYYQKHLFYRFCGLPTGFLKNFMFWIFPLLPSVMYIQSIRDFALFFTYEYRRNFGFKLLKLSTSSYLSLIFAQIENKATTDHL